MITSLLIDSYSLVIIVLLLVKVLLEDAGELGRLVVDAGEEGRGALN